MYIHRNKKSGYIVGEGVPDYTDISLPENVERMRRSRSVSMADSPATMSRNNALVMESHSLQWPVCNPCIGPNERPGIDGGIYLE